MAENTKKREEKVFEQSKNIIWNSFTLTGAFQARSLVLNVLSHNGFEYHSRRTLRTNYIFVGKGHPGNS